MQDPVHAMTTLENAVEQMILDRINVHGAQHSEAVQQAYDSFDAAVARLKATFSPEQEQMYICCDNAMSNVTGEIMDYYYRAGFADAVAIMNGGKNNAD